MDEGPARPTGIPRARPGGDREQLLAPGEQGLGARAGGLQRRFAVDAVDRVQRPQRHHRLGLGDRHSGAQAERLRGHAAAAASFGQFGGEFAEVVPYIAVLVVILIRPHGLFGQKEVERI